MSNIRIQRKLYVQPQGGELPNPSVINELSVCGGFVFSAGGSDSDLTGGRLVATAGGTVFPFGSVAGLSSSSYERGVYGSFYQDVGTSRVIHFYTGQPSSRNFTILTRLRLNTAPLAPGVVMRSGNLTAGGTTIPLWRNGSSFDMRISGTDYTAGGTWNLGQWYDIAIIGTTSSCIMISNGTTVINGSAASLSTIDPTFGFGDVTGGGISTGDLDISFCVICSKALSEQDVLNFFNNPWRLFKPSPYQIYTSPLSGIPTISNILMTNIRSNQATSNISLVF